MGRKAKEEGNEASRNGRPMLVDDRLLRGAKIPANKRAGNSREEAGNELLLFHFKSVATGIDLFSTVDESQRMCFSRV